MQTETVRRDRKHKGSAHMAWLTDPISPHGISDRSNQPTWHVWQIQSAHVTCTQIQSAHMACFTDPIIPHGIYDRSNQPTWHVWQIQSAHTACFTDPIGTYGMWDRFDQPSWHVWQWSALMACLTMISPHGMFDKSNQPTWHIWQIQSAHTACFTDPVSTHDIFDRFN